MRGCRNSGFPPSTTISLGDALGKATTRSSAVATGCRRLARNSRALRPPLSEQQQHASGLVIGDRRANDSHHYRTTGEDGEGDRDREGEGDGDEDRDVTMLCTYMGVWGGGVLRRITKGD